MPIVHAIALGIVQGLSEFLPISSSGHLAIVPWLFGWDELTNNPELNQTFDIALHIGTFVGVVVYFWADLVRIVASIGRTLRRRAIESDDERLAWLLVVATLPAATVGFVLDTLLEGHFGPEWLIGVMLIVFGLLLWWADRLGGRREAGAFHLRDAVLMGFAQALALQPGVSRSGATMTMGRWLGFERDAAARLSFLMSIPIIGGVGLYKAVDTLVLGDGIPAGFVAPFFWGTLAAGLTGFLAVWGLLRLISRRSFAPFVVYRIAVGLLVIGVAASSWR